MTGSEEVATVEELADDFHTVLFDLYEMYNPFGKDEQFITSAHVDLDVVESVPTAGDLKAGEVRLGDGTGSGGVDEIFFSVDGATVARVEADSTIT